MHEHRTATVDRQVRMVNNEQYEDNECLYLGSLFLDVHAHIPNDDDWMTKMVIGRQQISFKLDTGAQANVLPMKMFETLTPRVARVTYTKTLTRVTYPNTLTPRVARVTYTNYPVGIC